MKTSKEQSVPDKLLKKIKQTIRMHQMVQPRDTILTGVSGGPDSVALLYALSALSAEMRISLGVVHVNHGLRGRDSDADEVFVSELAGKLSLPLHVRRIDVQAFRKKRKLSMEEAARLLRYDCFLKIMKSKGYTKIATAHHLGDNAELILMNLIRGSGKTGLSGIPPIRQGTVIRPLIRTSRQEIMTYLADFKVPFRIDGTNRNNAFLRNRIRNQLIPELQRRYNPRVMDAVNRMGEIIRSEEAWIESIVAREAEGLIQSFENHNRLLLEAFLQKPLPLKRRIVRHMIRITRGDLRKITLKHVDQILSLVSKTGGPRQIHLPDNLQVVVDGGAVDFSLRQRVARPQPAERRPAVPLFQYRIASPDALPQTIRIQSTGAQVRFTIRTVSGKTDRIKRSPEIAVMDFAEIRFPLTIRSRLPGDRFQPSGLSGSQKVSKFFIDHKVPPPARAVCPIVLDADRILWIGGYRINTAVQLGPQTRTVLQAELLLAE